MSCAHVGVLLELLPAECHQDASTLRQVFGGDSIILFYFPPFQSGDVTSSQQRATQMPAASHLTTFSSHLELSPFVLSWVLTGELEHMRSIHSPTELRSP